jgi:DNA topoisomerase-1
MEKYTLVITEKPDAAHRIALALDVREKPRKRIESGVPYYVAKREKEIVVVPALGHLYTVVEEKKGRDHYPVFDFKWAPRYVAERRAGRIRTWIETIARLAKNADTFIDACDYDIEGSIIGYSILKYACDDKDRVSKRMKYSTLTREELEKSYAEPLPHLDFTLIEAGLARHEVDWLFGINLSRALTEAAKNWSRKYTTLSTGRVQGPTLKFVVAREKTIRSFVPTPYWEIRAEVEIDGEAFEAQYEKQRIESRHEADAIINLCENKDGKIEKIEVKQFQQPALTPFDLGALQSEAYRLFGYTPSSTSKIAQRLYLDALLSYPRTCSQRLPSVINYTTILKNLKKVSQYRSLTSELLARSQLKPREGKREDSAHPAIYPTGNMPARILDNSESRILDLVIRRFMAAFGEPALKQGIKTHINVNGHLFHLNGKQILKEGWMHFYEPYARPEETTLPPMEEGQIVTVRKVILIDKFTKPPPRYNPSSILRRMEETEIGTKATRAEIIQTLYDRKYVQGEKLTPTDLGLEVLEVMEKYCPTVVSTKFTRELEERMNKIQTNNLKKEGVLTEAVETLKPVVEKLKENQNMIGQRLSEAIRKSSIDERIIGVCPICKTGKLIVLYSRRTSKRFAGCTNYFKGLCKTSFPLPQRGIIKPLAKDCRECGWPTVQVLARGRRPWTLCFNPRCPLREGKEKAE